MIHKVLKAVYDHSLLKENDRVVVALSGGADSVALLHALNSLKEEYNITLYACHLNHLIRGDEAFSDEGFATALCKKMGIELFIKRVDIVKLSKERKESIELCARNERYAFFESLSEKLCAKVATAHTSSDNVETVLFNIARGTTLKGLCGITPTRDYIIRPLIYVSRREVEDYCDKNSLEFVTDSTNLTDEYTRNNIRHNAVPVLKSVNPELEFSVMRMSATMRDVKEFLDKCSLKELKECETQYGHSCEKLQKLDKAVLTNALYLLCGDKGCDVNFSHISLMIDAMESCGCVDLPSNMRCVCKQGVLRIVPADENTAMEENSFLDSGYAEYISKEEIKNINKKLLKDCINCDIITHSTLLRNKAEGDSFTLPERNVTKSVKKLLNELKIPAEKRSALKLVANGKTVLWLEGVGVSKHGAVDENCSGAYMITGGK